MNKKLNKIKKFYFKRTRNGTKIRTKRAVLTGVIVFILVSVFLFASKPALTEEEKEEKRRVEFIEKIAPYAQEIQEEYGVLASINIGQAVHESNFNNSVLSNEYNNFYGVKSENTNKDKSVILKTEEFNPETGEMETVDARFAKYKSWKDSMLAHTKLFVKGTDWNKNQYKELLESKTYRQAAFALYENGYATDPNYSQKLINIIEKYHLDKYDRK